MILRKLWTARFIPGPPVEEGIRYITNPKDPFPVASDDPNFIPPSEVLEIHYEEQKDMIKALRKGDLDVVDRLSPVTAMQLAEEPGFHDQGRTLCLANNAYVGSQL